MSLVIAGVLCFSMVPAQAFAKDDVSERSVPISEESAHSLAINQLDRSSQKNGVEADLQASIGLVLNPITNVSADRVQLNWSGVSSIKPYKVYRAISGETRAYYIGESSGNSYSDVNVRPGTLYAYIVVATLSATQEIESNIEAVATPPRNTTASVSATFPKGVTVKWNASEGATHYNVYRALRGSSNFNLVQSSSTTSFLDTSAVGKKYVYKVRPIFVMNNRVMSEAADTPTVSSDSGKWKISGKTKKFIFLNGSTAKSWQLISGKWYCFASSGKMLKSSFKKVGSKKYFLGSKGFLKTGWFSKGGKKYYASKTGEVAKGWKTISSKRYYFSKSGVLARNTYVNGYHLNRKGVWDGKFKYGSSVGTISVTRSLLPLVNKARKKVGSGTLKWDAELAETAKLRAIEIRKKFDHTRPNGKSCFTAFPDYLNGAGENIAMGQKSVSAVNIAWTNSPGHYSNMVNSLFNCFGAACFTIDGRKYWVELFGYK